MGQSEGLLSHAGSYEPLTGTAQAAQWVACVVFLLQMLLHWSRAWCVVANTRAQHHELLSGASTGVCGLLYLAIADGLSEDLYTVGSRQYRIFYHLLYVERAVAVGLLLLNISVLARERRPPAVALVVVWLASTSALYLGNAVGGVRRLAFVVVAVIFLLPVAAGLLGSMGERVRLSQLQSVYRFLATWAVVCSACYPLVYFGAGVVGLLDTETELLVYALLDYCTVGVSALIVSSAGPDVDAPLLPAQEAELSLYPGPHQHGFYPNPNYYDDNL
eukprot:gnl/TRDRNA2_/TRDRNA2_44339_c0_seq1.p1 gnl/TRDRNA2_/TRDRNA2_44339_c0~~gnl/TRDRNA2_/TRDRNA2_44339_c0_seq1.p1  ORF type:complete len:275 (-),score=17.28 gnl/TRDRNA2_/TRDRNA2_44339_c0_seq1:126-950(-)